MRDGRRVDDWGDAGASAAASPVYAAASSTSSHRAVHRAELDHPELTGTFEPYFHALEVSLGLRLPRRDFAEGEVRAAYWRGSSGEYGEEARARHAGDGGGRVGGRHR
ncbi:hypothetical protein [Streptomyces sp. NPDC054838]